MSRNKREGHYTGRYKHIYVPGWGFAAYLQSGRHSRSPIGKVRSL